MKSTPTQVWCASQLKALAITMASVEKGKNITEIPRDYKNSLATRMYLNICCIVCCSVPFAWSCTWRILCCPCGCMNGMACSNNGCTDKSDLCISTCCNEINVKVKKEELEGFDDEVRKIINMWLHTLGICQEKGLTRTCRTIAGHVHDIVSNGLIYANPTLYTAYVRDDYPAFMKEVNYLMSSR